MMFPEGLIPVSYLAMYIYLRMELKLYQDEVYGTCMPCNIPTIHNGVHKSMLKPVEDGLIFIYHAFSHRLQPEISQD